MTRSLPRLAALLAAAALASTGCGFTTVESEDSSVSSGDVAAGGAAGACLAGDEDCADDPSQGQGAPAPTDGTLPDDAYVAVAKGMLGLSQEEFDELSWDLPVRVGRVGDESYALTEDYVVGRQTVEFDDADGTMVVTSVTVELPGGPVEVDSVED
jgi:hypothetical protein